MLPKKNTLFKVRSCHVTSWCKTIISYNQIQRFNGRKLNLWKKKIKSTKKNTVFSKTIDMFFSHIKIWQYLLKHTKFKNYLQINSRKKVINFFELMRIKDGWHHFYYSFMISLSIFLHSWLNKLSIQIFYNLQPWLWFNATYLDRKGGHPSSHQNGSFCSMNLASYSNISAPIVWLGCKFQFWCWSLHITKSKLLDNMGFFFAFLWVLVTRF